MKLCDYGCGNEALFQLKNGKLCCSKSQNSCEIIKNKIGNGNRKLRREIPNFCDYGCGNKAVYYFKTVDKWCCSNHRSSCSSFKDISSKSHIGKHLTPLKLFDNIHHKLCDYNCGKEAKYISKHEKVCCNEFLSKCEGMKKKNSKGNIGRIVSIETRSKLSMSLDGHQVSKLTRDKISKSRKGKDNRTKESIEKQKQWMLNGGSVYIASFIKNPSKPQVELYNRVKELYPTAVLNYPCYRVKGKRNYSLDVAIPELKIWFESDGSWFHQNYNEDLKRQNEIEKMGWKLIRYKADSPKEVPPQDQIKNDIDLIISSSL